MILTVLSIPRRSFYYQAILAIKKYIVYIVNLITKLVKWMDAELRSGLEELEKKNITSLLLQNGAGERRHGLEELKKKITIHLLQNGSGERRG
jgi:hypothetical protein